MSVNLEPCAKVMRASAEIKALMRGSCEICYQRKARIFMVVNEEAMVAKAHVCRNCFAEMKKASHGEVSSLSREEFHAIRETVSFHPDLN